MTKIKDFITYRRAHTLAPHPATPGDPQMMQESVLKQTMEGVDGGRRRRRGPIGHSVMESDSNLKIKNKTTMKITNRWSNFATAARKGQWAGDRAGYGTWWAFSRRLWCAV